VGACKAPALPFIFYMRDELARLRLLNTIIQTLNQSLNLRSALESALTQTVELLGLETGWIFLYQQTTGSFSLAATERLPEGLGEPSPFWEGGCNCQSYFCRGELTAAANEVECSRLKKARRAKRETSGLRVHASVPLVSGRRPVGILNVASPSWDHFSETDLALLDAIGDAMAVTIERAQLHEQLKSQRLNEQAALLRLSHALLTTELNADAVIKQVATLTRELLHTDGAAVLLNEHGNEDPEACVLAEEGLPWECASSGELETGGPDGSLTYTLTRGFPISSPDLAEERRFSVPQALLAAGFRAALRAPLVAEGQPLGLLGAYCRTPRQFTEQEHRLLSLIANQAAIAISKARFYEASMARERLMQEVEVARSIQSSLLPAEPPNLPGWRVAAYWQPATTVAGDFYDFLPLRDGRLGIMIADVSDKGMAAALFMAMSRSVVRTMAFSRRRDYPSLSLIKANDLILADSRSDMFVTLFYGILDPSSGDFRFANAGHPPPIRIHLDGAISLLWQPGSRPPLGILPDITLRDQNMTIAPGDTVLFYTDGATDVFGPRTVDGQNELAQNVAALAHLPAPQLIAELVRTLRRASAQSNTTDDIALVLLQRLAGTS
jgi:serine phosphatase RsbU (regulator of sigma subunit)